MLPYTYYLQHLQRETGYRGNWFPDVPLKIGDIGRLEKGVFRTFSDLASQQIPIKTEMSDSDLSFDYSTKNGLSITTKASADIAQTTPVVDGKVTINISSTSDQAILFQTMGFKRSIITNLLEIENIVLNKYAMKQWTKDLVIITELLHTESATILISNSRNDAIELEATADAGISKFKLADSQVAFNIKNEKGGMTKFIGKRNLIPLYQIMGVRDPFFGNPSLKNRGDSIAIQDESFRILPFVETEMLEPADEPHR